MEDPREELQRMERVSQSASQAANDDCFARLFPAIHVCLALVIDHYNIMCFRHFVYVIY